MSLRLDSQRPVRQTNHLICEEVSGECVIYDGRHKKAHHLNSTLTWIWNRCDGGATVRGLASSFDKEFTVTNGYHIVLTGLQQLNANNLLENQLELAEIAAAEKAGVSRRSVVVGGSVLMPLMVSMIAPTPAAAKSPGNDKKPPKPKNK